MNKLLKELLIIGICLLAFFLMDTILPHERYLRYLASVFLLTVLNLVKNRNRRNP